jgi:glycosyltransferase involved in cell wall biosynthesis
VARVCVVRQHYVPKDTRVAREVAALAALGHEVDVICLRDRGEPLFVDDAGVRIWRVPLRHTRGRGVIRYLTEYGVFFAFTACALPLIHLSRRYRLIQINAPPDVLVLASIVPRLFGARILLDLQECFPEFFATKFGVADRHPAVRLISHLEQLSIRYADFVITPTLQMRARFVARGADPGKITVVMDGADEQIFSELRLPEVTARGEEFRLISHGTIERHYGLDTVVEAVALLREEMPQLRFDVYGEGSDIGRLRELATNRGVADQVRFSGRFVPIGDLVRAIAAADVGVVAVRRDPFRDVALASKMFEFIAMRKPIIASRTQSVEETFDESCIELFESGDAADLARAVRALHRDPERRARMVERAADVAKSYQWERQRHVYGAVVDRLLAA